jgi:hypothetical protein
VLEPLTEGNTDAYLAYRATHTADRSHVLDDRQRHQMGLGETAHAEVSYQGWHQGSCSQALLAHQEPLTVGVRMIPVDIGCR